jgi:signal transduction histidine kinase
MLRHTAKIFGYYPSHIIQCLRHFYQQRSKRPSQIITATVALTLLLFFPQIWMTAQAYQNFNSIIQHELRLQTLSDKITHLDEVLTMSARMNAATANPFWETRYRQFEPKLDAVIKESIKLAPDAYNSEDAKATDTANLRLVEMESRSLDLVRSGEQQAAQALLSSPEYETEKQKYADGVGKRNSAIAQQIQKKVVEYRQQLFISTFIAIVSLAILIPSWLLVLRILQEYLQARKIAQLALEETNQLLETRVQERTQELSNNNTQLQRTLEKLQTTQLQLIQTEKMSGLGQMVAGIAHEINNPITFVDGNLDYAITYMQDLLGLVNLYQQHYSQPTLEIKARAAEIELDFIQDDLMKLLKSMKVGTQRIADIVLSLRNFSRLDEATCKTVDIHAGIDSTLMILQHRCKGKSNFPGISVVKEYGNLPLVKCYPSQLNQVFMNILANAIDALEDGYKVSNLCPPTIRIQTQVLDEQWVVIRILDNGCGISEEIISKLFDPFFTTKEIGKGTGLGLSISYQIVVDKHHGKLSCQSTLGDGTEFTIEIPVMQLQQ